MPKTKKMMKNNLEISILNKCSGFSFKKKVLVKEIFNYILNMQEVQTSCLFKYNFKTLGFDLVFCDDNEIKKINAQYRKKDEPTDVITFALFADDSEPFVFGDEINLGEIIISYPVALKQAKNGVEAEIITLIAHGILHLLGFDHVNKIDYNFIVGIQNRIVEKFVK